jgi:signal transduction histidine kinase
MLIALQDKGPGIANAEKILAGQSEHVGLLGASRLIDKLTIENPESGGAIVQLEKEMSHRQASFSQQELDALVGSLTKLIGVSPIDELHQQNQELLAAMDLLSQKQKELDAANIELAAANENLSEINRTVLSLNESLELKVRERTQELQQSNTDLSIARDEAVLASKLKTQFVANISHEMRTPMSGILGATELALEGERLGTEDETLIKMAHGSAKRLLGIISDLLDFAKLEAGKPKLQETDFYVASVMDEATETVASAAKTKGLSITESKSAALSGRKMIGDSVLIKKVLVNILTNAIKFTDAGEVKLSVDDVEQGDTAWKVRWSVTDSGIGIDETDKDRLFQPFVQADGSNTRQYGGAGLGLALCRGYVDLMGGEIGVKSELGTGSEFWFVIPLRVVAD